MILEIFIIASLISFCLGWMIGQAHDIEEFGPSLYQLYAWRHERLELPRAQVNRRRAP